MPGSCLGALTSRPSSSATQHRGSPRARRECRGADDDPLPGSGSRCDGAVTYGPALADGCSLRLGWTSTAESVLKPTITQVRDI